SSRACARRLATSSAPIAATLRAIPTITWNMPPPESATFAGAEPTKYPEEARGGQGSDQSGAPSLSAGGVGSRPRGGLQTLQARYPSAIASSAVSNSIRFSSFMASRLLQYRVWYVFLRLRLPISGFFELTSIIPVPAVAGDGSFRGGRTRGTCFSRSGTARA